MQKRGKDLASCQGLYEAKIFQTIANKVYFKGPTDDGVALRSSYEPFPIVGIALIATAVRVYSFFATSTPFSYVPQVQCAIDEWAKGTHTKITFTDSAYSAEYTRHLRNLERYNKKSPEVVNSICTRLFEDGWYVFFPSFALLCMHDLMCHQCCGRGKALQSCRGGTRYHG